MTFRIHRASLVLLFSVLFISYCSVFPETRSSSSSSSSSSSLSKEDRLRQDIVSYAKEYLGSSYVYAGKDPRGFDCSGFTFYVMRKFDIDLSSSSKAQATQGRSIRVKDAKAGDLIYYRRSKVGRVFHVSLVVSNDRDGLKVIHSTSRGVVIDNISKSSFWEPKVSGARDVVSK